MAARNENNMPIAAIGPRLRFEFRSEKSRQRRAKITVAAEAAIGSIEFFMA